MISGALVRKVAVVGAGVAAGTRTAPLGLGECDTTGKSRTISPDASESAVGWIAKDHGFKAFDGKAKRV